MVQLIGHAPENLFAHLSLSTTEYNNEIDKVELANNSFQRDESYKPQKQHGLRKLSTNEPITKYTNSPLTRESLALFGNSTGNFAFQYSPMLNSGSSSDANTNISVLFSNKTGQLNSGGTVDNLSPISLFDTSTTFNLPTTTPLSHLTIAGTSNNNPYDSRQQIQQNHTNLPSSIHLNKGFSSEINYLPKSSVIGENSGYVDNSPNRAFVMHSPGIPVSSTAASIQSYIGHAQHHHQHQYYHQQQHLSQASVVALPSTIRDLSYNKIDSSNITSPAQATPTATPHNIFFNEYAR